MADILHIINGASPTTDESAIETALTGAGHTVTTINDAAPVPGDVGDYDCIVVGPDASAADLGTKYRDTAVPAVVTGG